MKRFLFAFALVAVAGSALHADEYPDAQTVLKRLSERADSPPAAEVDPATATFQTEVKSYQERLSKLSADESAAEWLSLFHSGVELSNNSRYRPRFDHFGFDEQESGIRQALLALPPPQHWAALAQAIEARRPPKGEETARDLALRLLAAMLNDDAAARTKVIAELRESLGDAGERDVSEELDALLAQLGQERAPRDQVADFEKQLAEQPQPYRTLNVPDLVTLVGPERAEALLIRALTTTAWTIEVRKGDATRKLAAEVALKHVDRLQSPPWQLVESAGAIGLYEALDKRFPTAQSKGKSLIRSIFGGRRVESDDAYGPGRYHRQRAAMVYLAALIAAERTDDATKLLDQLGDEEHSHYMDGSELVAALEKTGSQRRAYDLLRTVVSEKPGSPLWHAYLRLAADVGKTAEALETVKAVAARPDLDESKRATVQGLLVRGLLAADETDEAIKTIRGRAKSPDDGDDGEPESPIELARLGILLEQPDLAKEGIDAAVASLKERPADDGWRLSHQAPQVAAMLVQTGRGPEAAELLVEAMQRLMQTPDQDFESRSELVRPLLIELVSTYHRAGRHADILALVEKAPYWGHADLSEFLEESDTERRPIGYFIAAALSATDRRADARKILEVLLDVQPGYDPAYELLVQVIPDRDEAIATLDALLAADRFEERPLIWKAHLLRAAGRLVEAEQAARQAIAIDPSDGEQPRGDRMRAYAVLADILEAKGGSEETAKEAALYRSVVKAIRMSEDADRLYAAGLLRRAVRLYKRSLAMFEDAYCIQSRLAVQLAEAGDFEAAEPHYRKAYELMPDSFGRVESHCFGCEGAFRGALAQKIAEETFTRLAKEKPNKPQVHYLLAYLREQQARHAEAVEPLRKAVQLDPDYLNAWKMLSDLPQEAGVPPAERETAVLNIIRLDPRQRHSRASLEHVRDARALWTAVEQAGRRQAVRPKSLYPLPAAAEALASSGSGSRFSYSRYDYFDDALRTPAHALLAMPAFETVSRLLEME